MAPVERDRLVIDLPDHVILVWYVPVFMGRYDNTVIIIRDNGSKVGYRINYAKFF